MNKMTSLGKAISCAVIGLSLLTGCENRSKTFTESADLDRDGSKELITIEAYQDGDCSVKIEELDRVKATKEGLLGPAKLTYDNEFFNKSPYWLRLPIFPQSVGFRDTNGDRYKDLVFHSEKNGDLESYVAEQTGDGGIKQPRKIDIQPYVALDKATDLYERSFNVAFRGDYKGAIHLAEWSLEFLNPENPQHHETLFNVYKNLSMFYENDGNKEKLEEIKTKSLNLRLFRGRI